MTPTALATHPLVKRLEVAIAAVRGAGAALMSVRVARHVAHEIGDQLKTSVDRAAEGWVLGYLATTFPAEVFLAEELQSEPGASWQPQSEYWTVDALDGTRSYVDGYDGFTVQVSFVRGGVPVLSAIDEPAKRATWVALAGAGAFVLREDAWSRVRRENLDDWPKDTRFTDSKLPSHGKVLEMMSRHRCRFVECGGVGAKALRIAAGDADVFAKEFTFKLWDVAPVDLLLREAGARLGAFDGSSIVYDTSNLSVAGVLAAPAGLFDKIAREREGTR